jgi:hypothetical protein
LKKTLGLVLILILALGLIGCSDMGVSDDDSLGYGNIIVSSDIIEVLDGDGNELPDVDLSDVVVKVNGEEGSLGEEIAVEIGSTYEASLSLTLGETEYVGSKSDISVTKGETTLVNDGAIALNEVASTNVYEITFDPAEYDGVTVNNEVHLAGSMQGWDPADKSYALTEEDDGTWTGTFLFIEGTEFKFIYDEDSWGTEVSDGGNNFNLDSGVINQL